MDNHAQSEPTNKENSPILDTPHAGDPEEKYTQSKPRKLSIKQRKFVKEYVKTGDATKAVLKVYDAKNTRNAKRMSYDLKSKPAIQKSIEDHLKLAGYDPEESIRELIGVQGADAKIKGSDKVKAIELLLKLSGNFVERSVQGVFKYDVDRMQRDQLIDHKERYEKLITKRK